jgi:SAM-dependent methyltransferase
METEERTGTTLPGDLLEEFLGNRSARTQQAYRIDIEDFGRFLGEPPPAAVARLLSGGPGGARHLALEFAIDLRRRERAPATVNRRLATLRALLATAHDGGMIDWLLPKLRQEEVSAAIEERARSASYMLPRHPSEVDRLDVQHYALRAAMGSTHLAPVARARRVLDSGCGTGQWGFELCAQFPEALVVGLDLVPGKAGGPPAHRFVRANVLQGLPFADGRFDLVHQRLLVTGIPFVDWPRVVADLVRVTAPGGWVELVEPRREPDGPAAATRRIFDLALDMATALELDTGGVVFGELDAYLRDAGLEQVTRRELVLPIGHWGGDVGALMATDLRAGSTRMCEMLQARSRISEREARELIEGAQAEWEEHRTTWTFAVVYGRRPG